MLSRFYLYVQILCGIAFSLMLFCASAVQAQTDSSFGEADPIKLFERGQDAHSRGDLKRALEFYEEAIKLKTEFPEAEYQRAEVLLGLNRLPDAEKAYRRAMELRPDWALPYAKLGFLLGRVMERASEAEPLLRHALALDAKSYEALFELAVLRSKAKDFREATELFRRATATGRAGTATWDALGATQFMAGDVTAAIASYSRALEITPGNLGARQRRAEAYIVAGDNERALEDLRALRGKFNNPDTQDTHSIVELARLYARAGRSDEALKMLDALNEEAQRSPEVIALRTEIDPAAANSPEARAALEKLLQQNPRNASLLAHLGSLYRTIDPQRSLEHYRRAVEIEPRNADYATGYAAALVQARRFAEAVTVLRRVIAVEPNHFAAHANLAIALYEMKLFPEAVAEYSWLLEKKPDTIVAHFFIATAYDHLGEFEKALAAYETFLARADAQKNKQEIDKIKLRLPSLRNQIKNGEGAKPKKQKQ